MKYYQQVGNALLCKTLRVSDCLTTFNQMTLTDVDSVVSFESFSALKLSNSESFRALKLSLSESFRVIEF